MIKISRIVDNNVDVGNSYEIYINDILLDKLNNGESKSFRLKIGTGYKIVIKDKNRTSNEIVFDMLENQTIEFECGPMYKETFFSMFKKEKEYKNKYIRLVMVRDFYL